MRATGTKRNAQLMSHLYEETHYLTIMLRADYVHMKSGISIMPEKVACRNILPGHSLLVSK